MGTFGGGGELWQMSFWERWRNRDSLMCGGCRVVVDLDFQVRQNEGNDISWKKSVCLGGSLR